MFQILVVLWNKLFLHLYLTLILVKKFTNRNKNFLIIVASDHSKFKKDILHTKKLIIDYSPMSKK